MKLLRLLIVPVLALALNIVVSAGATHAQNPADDTFDINAFNYYCTAGSATCNPANAVNNNGYFCSQTTGDRRTCAGLNYGAVQASGDMMGTNYGTPGLVTLACENFTGPGSFNAGYVNVSTSAFYNTWGDPNYDDDWVDNFSHGPWINTTYNPDYYPSALGAKATLLGDVNEDTSDSTSSVTVSAYDAYWGTLGSVTGIQNADDTSGYDTPMGGQFRITIHGTATNGMNLHYGLVHFTNYGSSYTYYTGTISCTVGGPDATTIGESVQSKYSYETPWRTGSYGAEGEIEDYPLYEYDHNCAYAPILVNDPWGNRCLGAVS